jgi:hypothetical protein
MHAHLPLLFSHPLTLAPLPLRTAATGRSGEINVKEFSLATSGRRPMPMNVLDFVRQKFRDLDVNGDQSLTKGELLKHFQAHLHPAVASGAKGMKQVVEDLVLSFNGTTRITLEEWEVYTHGQWAAAPTTQAFMDEIDKLWPSSMLEKAARVFANAAGSKVRRGQYLGAHRGGDDFGL